MTSRRKKRTTAPRRIEPINLGDTQSVPEFSGFLIIRLKPDVVSSLARSLDEVAREFKMDQLARLLQRDSLPSQRLVTSLSVNQLLELESGVRSSEFAPLHSMTSYWRLDARKLKKGLQELLQEFRDLLREEVELVYLEKSASEPAVFANDEFANKQRYLDPAPIGIDARAAWDKNVDGAGLDFIDLERAWILTHEDLPTVTLIRNCNFDFDPFRNHGTSVLGVVAGVNNALGIVGIAPKVNSVRLVSYFIAASCENGHTDQTCNPSLGGTHTHIADAICAAAWANPRPHVLLLEVQQIGLNLPIETESDHDHIFNAIRLAVSHGITVIEAAGNASTNLDNWVDAAGQKSMNRKLWTSTEAKNFDSGAILVGAAKKATVKISGGVPAHKRHPVSNFGSRVDCYAWGEGIVSTGGGDLRPRGTNRNVSQVKNKKYTAIFDGTSGASAIIAGAALLVQGLHLKANRRLLSPAEMRAILSNPATGTPTIRSGHIGVMPDLRQIIQTLGL